MTLNEQKATMAEKQGWHAQGLADSLDRLYTDVSRSVVPFDPFKALRRGRPYTPVCLCGSVLCGLVLSHEVLAVLSVAHTLLHSAPIANPNQLTRDGLLMMFYAICICQSSDGRSVCVKLMMEGCECILYDHYEDGLWASPPNSMSDDDYSRGIMAASQWVEAQRGADIHLYMAKALDTVRSLYGKSLRVATKDLFDDIPQANMMGDVDHRARGLANVYGVLAWHPAGREWRDLVFKLIAYTMSREIRSHSGGDDAPISDPPWAADDIVCLDATRGSRQTRPFGKLHESWAHYVADRLDDGYWITTFNCEGTECTKHDFFTKTEAGCVPIEYISASVKIFDVYTHERRKEEDGHLDGVCYSETPSPVASPLLSAWQAATASTCAFGGLITYLWNLPQCRLDRLKVGDVAYSRKYRKNGAKYSCWLETDETSNSSCHHLFTPSGAHPTTG